MKFTAKTNEEINEANLLPEGLYDAEIGTAEDMVSSKGNDMIKLDLAVFDANGNKRFLFDYLLEAMAFKLRHAAEACGLLAKYEAGELHADDFIGKCCRVKVGVDNKVKSNAKNGTNYPPSNTILDYIVEGGAKDVLAKADRDQKTAAKDKQALDDDSDLPF